MSPLTPAVEIVIVAWDRRTGRDLLAPLVAPFQLIYVSLPIRDVKHIFLPAR